MGVRPPDLRGYFQDRYSADNMCVCVASALGHSEVFDAVSRAFGGRGGNLKPVMVEQELPQQCPREVLEYSNCDVSKCLLLKCRAEIPWSPLSGIAPRCLLAKVIRPY